MIRTIFNVDHHAVTHSGRVRELNEDRYLASPENGVFVVADGMGGHDAGEIASTSIVEHLRSIGMPSSAPDLRARFEDRMMLANSEIRGISMMRDGVTIGSTVAGLLAFERQYACVWAGDSRVYMLRAGQLYQVSRDHTEVQDLLDRGLLTQAEAASYARRNVITRAIGVMNSPPLEITQGQILPEDKFMICSDGLTAHVRDEEIRDALAGLSAHQASEWLVNTTLERGATDNVTVITVHFRGGDNGQLQQVTTVNPSDAPEASADFWKH